MIHIKIAFLAKIPSKMSSMCWKFPQPLTDVCAVRLHSSFWSSDLNYPGVWEHKIMALEMTVKGVNARSCDQVQPIDTLQRLIGSQTLL